MSGVKLFQGDMEAYGYERLALIVSFFSIEAKIIAFNLSFFERKHQISKQNYVKSADLGLLEMGNNNLRKLERK